MDLPPRAGRWGQSSRAGGAGFGRRHMASIVASPPPGTRRKAACRRAAPVPRPADEPDCRQGHAAVRPAAGMRTGVGGGEDGRGRAPSWRETRCAGTTALLPPRPRRDRVRGAIQYAAAEGSGRSRWMHRAARAAYGIAVAKNCVQPYGRSNPIHFWASLREPTLGRRGVRRLIAFCPLRLKKRYIVFRAIGYSGHTRTSSVRRIRCQVPLSTCRFLELGRQTGL